MKEADVVMAELWLDGSVLIEERWEDVEDSETGEILQETRYALPGGKVENGETEVQAIIREVKEETGIVLDPDDPAIANSDPEIIQEEPKKVVLFRKLLTGEVKLKDGVLVCSPPDILDFGDRGKLMPYSEKYVNENYRMGPDGVINH